MSRGLVFFKEPLPLLVEHSEWIFIRKRDRDYRESERVSLITKCSEAFAKCVYFAFDSPAPAHVEDRCHAVFDVLEHDRM